jgi:phage terminase large subunit-like protein
MTTVGAERFNTEVADKVVNFMTSQLTFTEGDLFGEPFVPLPWQETIVRDVFGTQVYSDEFGIDVRRYKTAYIEVPRKNGKSAFLSAIGIIHLLADPTLRGSDIVCVAKDKDQAAIVFNTAAAMIEANPTLAKRCYIAKRSHKRIENKRNGNRLFVIPGDADGALGLRPAVIIFDELLAQQNRKLFDAVTTGQGAARQPLLWMITTAGEYGTLCYEQHEYGEKVASGEIDDPSFYYVRFGMNEGDDWTDPEVWKRVNPSIGQTVSMSWLQSEFTKAQSSLEKQLAFRKYYLNEWNLSETSWLDMSAWDQCGKSPIDMEDLKGLPVWIGVDLSSRTDITAVVSLFLTAPDHYTVVPYLFLPEDGISDRSRRDGVPYQGWADNGLMILTPGRTVDYGAVFDNIREIAEFGDFQNVGYDQHNAGDLEQQLNKVGLSAYDVPQGFWLSEPLKEIEAAMLDGRISHGGHPVLKWMAGNAVIKLNDVGRIRLVKKTDRKRIDGLAALANAFDRALRTEEAPVSVYETRGLRSLS